MTIKASVIIFYNVKVKQVFFQIEFKLFKVYSLTQHIKLRDWALKWKRLAKDILLMCGKNLCVFFTFYYTLQLLLNSLQV